MDCKLEKLKLKGNLLMNEGIFQLIRGLECNESVTMINIADN